MAKEARVILNASPEVVVGKYDSATYKFLPKQRVEIMNPYAVAHLLERWGKYGLIEITWSPSLEAQYVDYELYVHEKELEGLTNAAATIQESITNYEVFENECGDKRTVERVKFKQQAEGRRRKLAELEAHIAQVQGLDTKKMLSDKADDLRKRAEALVREAARISGNDTGKFKDGNQNRAARP